MILFRGVVELLRALADGVELGLSVISPLDIPPQPEASPARVSASAAGDEVPAGVGPPTAPAGHLTASDLEMAAMAAEYRGDVLHANSPASRTYWHDLAEKFNRAADALMQ